MEFSKNINNNNQVTSNISNTLSQINMNDSDGVPEGIPEKVPEPDHPYMGNLTSHQIGTMAKAGQLGGEMVRRMVKQVEQEMADGEVDGNSLM